MKDWYLRQTPRDRIIVLVVGALSVVGIFYAFVWYPIATGINDNATLINSKRDTLQKVEVASAKLKALDGTSSSDQLDPGNKAPYVLIDERIRAAKVSTPDSVTPKGSEGARVQFSVVEFDKLVLVIAELERYGLRVDTLNVTRNPEVAGMVSARFEMEKN